jgi:LysM repeat protein
MSSINGPSGVSSAPGGWADSSAGPGATVQVGEATLADVAKRLGIEPTALAAANPQLADPANLKPGQEIRLPQLASPSTQADSQEPASSPTSLPAAPVGDPLASTIAQGALLGSSRSLSSTTPVPASISNAAADPASPLTTADLQNLPLTSNLAADPSAKQTLQLVGLPLTVNPDDLKQASRLIGTEDGAASYLASLLSPYFGLKTGTEVREDTSASSKVRAEAIQALQNDMLLTSVRLAGTVSPGFAPLNLSGEETIRSDAQQWKDDTSQKMDDVLKHGMAAARLMKSQEHAKAHLAELTAKLSGLMNQATVELANALAATHHNPKHRKGVAA